MDIDKLKAEFEASECFKRLEHVVQYTFFEFGAYIKRTDVPDDIEKKAGKMILALILSWSAWKEAKAQAVPEGFVLVEIKDLRDVISNAGDAMMNEETSSVYDRTGEPSTWFDHHTVAEKRILKAIEAQEQKG